MPDKKLEAALLLIDVISGYILVKRIGARILLLINAAD